MSQRLKASGRFKARIAAHGVSTSAQKNLPQWVARFVAFQQEGVLTDANGTQLRDANGRPQIGWLDLDDSYEITEYIPLCYLDKDNGSQLFTNSFTNLMEALHWTPNPSDIFGSLQSLNLDAVIVQIVVEEEVYDNKPTWRVKFVNPEDFDGMGVRQLDATGLATLNNQWAAAFRAKFAGGQAAAPAAPAAPRAPGASQTPAAPTASAPARSPAGPGKVPTQAQSAAPSRTAAAPAPVAGAAPTTTKAPTKAPAQASAPVTGTPNAPPPPMPGHVYVGGEVTSDEAYTAFHGKKAANQSDQAVGEEWFRIIAENLGARTDEEIASITPAQWAWVRDHCAPLPF